MKVNIIHLFLLFFLLIKTNISFAQNKDEKIYNQREIHKDFSNIPNIDKKGIENKEITTGDSLNTYYSNAPNINTTRYRRTSLYTMVTNSPAKTYNIPFINAFGNSSIKLPEKYNDHNVGPYQIPINQEGNLATQIENYLNNNNVAKQLIAKWFRRMPDGTFDMKLVADRGEYDASFLEQSIAKQTVRGTATLQDAGEELISQTYLIVYDFNFTDYKKSFTVDMDCYLYRLVWNDDVANLFYYNYWIDRKTTDQAKKEAFDNSSDFKMQYVGTFKNLESITKKYLERNYVDENGFSKYRVDKDYSTVSGNIQHTDLMQTLFKKSFIKLEEAVEDFRTKFPLYSANPIAAKIGSKEDIRAGDTFEVLEKYRDKENNIQYKRIGIITITDNNKVWDNNTKGDWLGNSKSKLEYTVFEGDKKKYAPGMLFRKIYN
jgi:hypothetical protein